MTITEETELFAVVFHKDTEIGPDAFVVAVCTTWDEAEKAAHKALIGEVRERGLATFVLVGADYLYCTIQVVHINRSEARIDWAREVCLRTLQAERQQCEEDRIINQQRVKRLDLILKGDEA